MNQDDLALLHWEDDGGNTGREPEISDLEVIVEEEVVVY
jgi:hypothetical protein